MAEDRCAAPFEMITEHLLLPSGCTPDLPGALTFEVRVKYKGEYRGRSGGGWAVENHGDVLSRAGNWDCNVPRFRRWQYRFQTKAEALDAARRAVDDVRVMGMTWAQFQERTTEQEGS